MRREKRLANALLCALALAANGAGALAQEKGDARQAEERRATERIAQEIQAAGGGLQIAGGGVRVVTLPDGQAPPTGGGVVVGQPGEFNFTLLSTEMAFDSKVVKGVPFSADAVTESVQTLADGNRIAHTATAKLFRDSEGRTRREQSLVGAGAWSAGEGAPQTVFINDPVAGTGYVLNTKTHTAEKVMTFSFVRPAPGSAEGGAKTLTLRADSSRPEIRGGVLNARALKRVQPAYPPIARAAGAEGPVEVQVTVDEQGGVSSAKAVSGHPLLQQAAVDAARQWTFSQTMLQGQPVKVSGLITFNFALSGKGGEAGQGEGAAPGGGGGSGTVMFRTEPQSLKMTGNVESLGAQTVEGVQAEGTRTTMTIPPGAMGNERPIQIVSERWYSQELQAVVMTKHSDPRFGETTYRLTNITRAEPDHSLFEVPAGYNVVDRGGIERMMIRTPAPPQP